MDDLERNSLRIRCLISERTTQFDGGQLDVQKCVEIRIWANGLRIVLL